MMAIEGKRTVARNELDGLSYKQLLDLKDKVEKAIIAKRDEERADVKAALAELAEKRGFSLEDLIGARRGKGKTVAVKYINPDNRAETWTGRGRKPNWLVNALKKSGVTMEKFLV